MSKSQGPPPSGRGDEDDFDLPPTYIEALTTGGTSSSGLAPSFTSAESASSSRTRPFSSPLTTHLQTLQARMRQRQLARTTEQASQDLLLITQLVPPIEAFLAQLAGMSRAPPRAELTLIPAGAVEKGWAMSGAAERRREGEVVRLVRVPIPTSSEKGGLAGGEKGQQQRRSGFNSGVYDDDDDGFGDENEGDGHTSSLQPGEPGFDEWGRFDDEEDAARSKASSEAALWFRDESMARRLATYLRPEPTLERKHVQAVVADGGPPTPSTVSTPKETTKQKSGGGSWWQRGKKATTPLINTSSSSASLRSQTASPTSPLNASNPLGFSGAETRDGVSMTVSAEEITFRRENEFGVWESLSGFGIVVTVRVSALRAAGAYSGPGHDDDQGPSRFSRARALASNVREELRDSDVGGGFW